ncbi:MAG: hypothetical protein WB780_12805 [Candidatus Acidiferrales bacterium]
MSEIALLLFGVMLVIGLVGEYAESEKWKKREKIFKLLVIIGVAGELFADGGVFLFSAHLQTISDAEVATLNKEAGEARRDAADAQLHTAKLEQRLADRHVTLEQRKKMLGILSARSGPRASVTFLTPAEPDAQEYAIEIGGVFQDAKWTVVPFTWLISQNTPVHGFAIEIRQNGPASKRKLTEIAARQALSVLDDRILVTYTGTDPNQSLKLDLLILVGNK